ncbi:hypothetical protein Tco_0417446 [Tanacetum coccineum]
MNKLTWDSREKIDSQSETPYLDQLIYLSFSSVSYAIYGPIQPFAYEIMNKNRWNPSIEAGVRRLFNKLVQREELSRDPSVSELFLRTHQNKKKLFVDATAKATWNKNRWNPSIEAGVRRLFNKVGSKSISDLHSLRQGKRERTSQTLVFPELFLPPPSEQREAVCHATAKQYDLNFNSILVVKAQSSSEKRLRKYVAQEVGKVVANEVGKEKKWGKATRQILDAIRIRPV